MLAAGLSEMPPVSNVMPLPTNATGGKGGIGAAVADGNEAGRNGASLGDGKESPRRAPRSDVRQEPRLRRSSCPQQRFERLRPDMRACRRCPAYSAARSREIDMASAVTTPSSSPCTSLSVTKSSIQKMRLVRMPSSCSVLSVKRGVSALRTAVEEDVGKICRSSSGGAIPERCRPGDSC